MNVIIVGSINKDIVLRVQSIAKNGETISALSETTFIGGKGYNQAVAISKVHSDTFFYCNVNKNDLDLIDEINNQSFNSNHVQYVSSKTGTAYIQVDNTGENSIVISKNANNEIDLDVLKSFLQSFSKGDLLVLQNEINDIDEIIKIGKTYGLKIVLNPSPITNAITKSFIDNVDMIFVNQHEVSSITNTATIESAIRYINVNYPNKEFVITLGSKGAMYLYRNSSIFAEAHHVEVIDTTCAGDTFLGYFIGYYVNNHDIPTCLQYASKAASISIGRNGASQSIPDKNEVNIKEK